MFRDCRRKTAVVLLASLAGVPSVVRADDSPAAVTAPREHQAVLTPSALTQPGRTIAIDLNGVVPGVTIAPVDFAQLQLGGLWVPRDSQVDFRLWLALLKVRIVQTNRVQASVFGAAMDVVQSASSRLTTWGVGAAVTVCFMPPCRAWVSVLGGVGHKSTVIDTSPNSGTGVFVAANGRFAITDRIAVIAEAARLGEHNSLFSCGARIHLGRFALDAAVVRLRIANIGLQDPPVLPWLGATYRFGS